MLFQYRLEWLGLQSLDLFMSRFVGPTEIFISGDTLQLKDYNKTDWPWTLFDPKAKKA